MPGRLLDAKIGKQLTLGGKEYTVFAKHILPTTTLLHT